MRTSDLYCTASIAGGVITLESGRQIDLPAIERSLKLIVATEQNAGWENAAAAHEEAIDWARHALKQFNGEKA